MCKPCGDYVFVCDIMQKNILLFIDIAYLNVCVDTHLQYRNMLSSCLNGQISLHISLLLWRRKA